MNPSPLSQLARRTELPPISWMMKMGLDRPNLISLAAGFTDNESLPVSETRELLGRLFKTSGQARAALQYGSTEGALALRRFTADRIQELDRGKAVDPERVLITHGSQQLLYLISECLCDPGDIVLVEDPTYFVYLSIAESHGLRCLGIPLKGDGIDLDRLGNLLESLRQAGDLRRVKMLVLITYFQNPTGLTSSLAVKTRALDILRAYERAAGHPIYLLEDAAYRELRFAGPDIPSALVLKNAEKRVIYLGTYSKPFATGIRVGFGVLPEPLYSAAVRVKANHDFGTSHFLQQILIGALQSGLYQKHLEKVKQRYGRKARKLHSALKRHFPSSVTWQKPQGGLYIWASLPRAMRAGLGSDLFAAALSRNVLYVPGALCYAPAPRRRQPQHEMRLSFGSARLKDLHEGARRLGLAISDAVDS